MKQILFTLFLLSSFSAFAQVPKQQKGTVYGDPGSDIIISEPKAEAGKSAGASYYQKDGKYGFVYPNDNKQEAIYNQISFRSNGFIVKKDGLYGIADKKGIVIGKIEYDSIGTNSYDDGNNVRIVKKKGKYGTISEDGKPILSIKYNKILFSGVKNPISLVNNDLGNVELIFNQQEQVFPQKIDFAEVYANLTILKANGKFGVVTNQIIVPFEYDSIFVTSRQDVNYYGNKMPKVAPRPFTFNYSKLNKTLSCITVLKNGKYGLIDNSGKIIYPAENDLVKPSLTDQYYTIQKGNLLGIYFTSNKKKTELEFQNVYEDGLGYVMAVKSNKAGVLSYKGEQLVPFDYDPDFIMQLKYGFRVKKNKKSGIVSKTGLIIVPPVYDDVDSFYENGFEDFIKVKSGENYGIINLKGNLIIPVAYEWIGVENGLFKVKKTGTVRRFGLLDKNGKIIVPVEYEWITHTDSEYSKIAVLMKDANSYNFLNDKNKLILPANVSQYGYVLDQDKLLNPLSPAGKSFIFLKSKNSKFGLLNEKTGILDIPIIYDEILQRLEGRNHIYFSVKKGKLFGLINEKNQVIIPIKYDAINLDFVNTNSNETFEIVVAKGKKFGAVNQKNKVKIPFQYNHLQRISENGIYKAKIGKDYQIINLKNEIINKGPFDEVANFEQFEDNYGVNQGYRALTFYNGKMKLIDDKGKFTSSEVTMQPHKGYKTFDDLKAALVMALNSKNDTLLKNFADKIAPSPHILYYLKENLFDKKSLAYTDLSFVKKKYYSDLLLFKEYQWNKKNGFSYNSASLTQVTDYTLYRNGYVTNARNTDHAFGDSKFMEKLLRNSYKINGFWISSYFMIRNFDRFNPL